MPRLRRCLRLAAGPALLLAIVAAGSVAAGAIPGPGGQITACYGKVGGVMRVVDPDRGQHCNAALETSFTLSQAGPRGPAGEPGPTGPRGASGTAEQSGVSVFSTGEPFKVVSEEFTTIPGLTKALSVPAGAVVDVRADGGAVSHTPAWALIGISVDGAAPGTGPAEKRPVVASDSTIAPYAAQWNIGHTYTLPAGLHTFEIQAQQLTGGTFFTGGGLNDSSYLQSQLTVIVLKTD